jgi:crotonobetaine/carnitine-CoA ligase
MGERYSATTFWDEIRKYKATAFHFLGAMPNFIYAQPPSPDDKNHNVKVAFGGPISVELCKEFEKRFNLKVCLGYYGLTEASGVTFMSAEEANSLKSEGRWEEALSAGRENKDIYEVKLVDDDDNEVPIGEVGEIICRPARPFAMISEYVNNPKATVKAFRNLWFHTGDLAKKDEHGYFYFVDRKKDYIRRRGENVSSFEVEWVINSHPAVLESAAIGIKSEFGEDEIKILVVLKDGEILKPEDIIKWCEPRMAYFMIPRYIEFRKELPKTPVGRIEKYKLREEGITPNTWDREKAGYKIKR